MYVCAEYIFEKVHIAVQFQQLQAIEFYFSSVKGSKISEGVLYVPSSKKSFLSDLNFGALANYFSRKTLSNSSKNKTSERMPKFKSPN